MVAFAIAVLLVIFLSETFTILGFPFLLMWVKLLTLKVFNVEF
jgi:hypothetical protein